MSEFEQAIEDPTLRALVALAERDFRGDAAGATATVSGAMSVTGVVAEPALRPADAGFALVEAINAALDAAEAATLRAAEADPNLAAPLKAVLAGGELDAVAAAGGVDLTREFEGTSGEAVVRVSGRTRRVTSVYVYTVDDASLADVVIAANRALASAALGRDGAVGLDEQFNATLSRLDEKMTALEGRLDAVDESLDRILRDLG